MVYTLRDGKDESDLLQALSAQSHYQEPIRYNGFKGKIEILGTEYDFDRIRQELGTFVDFGQVIENQRTILLDIPKENKVIRYMFVKTGDFKPITIFRLHLPKEVLTHKLSLTDWPKVVPEPEVTSVNQIMELEKSKSYTIRAKSDIQLDWLSNRFHEKIVSENWQIQGSYHVTGNIYLSKDQKQLLQVLYLPQKDQSTEVQIYLKNLEK